jgi:hypothetical protein
MNSFKKIIGLLVMIFIAMPLLFAIIWAVGITKAVGSPEFLSDIPQEVIAQVPDLVDEILAAMQEEDFSTDENAREWLEAITETDTSPKELMEETGLLNWLQDELSASLRDIGDILRGEMRPREITLDMRPLKQVLQHKAMDRYMMNIISGFPPCQVDEIGVWAKPDSGDAIFTFPPPCQPDPMIIEEALKIWRNEVAEKIPDKVGVFQYVRFWPRGFNTVRAVTSSNYLLFLIPAAFIALGALIGSDSRPGFLRWSGVTTIIGGIIPLSMAMFAGNTVSQALNLVPMEYFTRVSIQLQEIVMDKAAGVLRVIVNQLFSPVFVVSGTVCVVGAVLFALSFVFSSWEKDDLLFPKGM